ncbi:MAG: hypothetical protein HFI51_09295 [Lachnospiraceae bacterium]|nr:hypothetical protein [Lachnospiraceae bacterium]
MKIFLKLTSLSVQGQLYYRTSFLINLLTPVILLCGQYLLWDALYAQQSYAQQSYVQQGAADIGGMSRADMFAYILVAFAVSNLVGWSGENTLAKEIKSGRIVARCTRPAAFLIQTLSELTGTVLIQGVVNLAIVVVGFGCFGRYMKLPSLQAAFLFLPCMFLAVLLRMMVIDVFSLFCFFTTGYLGIAWTRTALFEFFSGAMIPVALFPDYLKTITYFTPFPYMLQVPIAVLLGQELPGSPAFILVMQFIWLILFWMLHCAVYGLARRNMTIAGG